MGRSVAALLAGFVLIVVASLGTDQLLHSLEVYPPWGEPMREPGSSLLALSYRVVYAILGSAVAALLAPSQPMRHALALGVVGLALSTAGAVAAIQADLGPAWYPIALALGAVPCAWLGGVLERRRGAAA